MTQAWRVRLKSGRGDVDHRLAREFAITKGIVGAGWGLSDPTLLPDCSNDFDKYVKHAKLEYPSDKSLEKSTRMYAEKMQVGDICWLYVTHSGEYWCAVIEGEFVYRCVEDFRVHDLHVIRPCRWAKAGTAECVPGVVRRGLAGTFGTISPIQRDKTVAIKCAQQILGLSSEFKSVDFYSAADPDDLEDVVALFLQNKGWSIFPSTSKATMASYEFVLVHKASGRRAGLQVKSGGVPHLSQSVSDEFDDFFCFASEPCCKSERRSG
ncbi:MAG: hypothetical protein ACX939_04330 [Hyphococcus sp.]